MKLTAQKTLLEKASAIIEVIEYAERRIQVREENLKQYEVFSRLDDKYKQANEITKLAKARLELYYKNTIARLLALDQDEDQDQYQTVTAEDLDTTVRVLDVVNSRVKYLEKTEYHAFKKDGHGIQFDNVKNLRGVVYNIGSVIINVNEYKNGL